MNRTMCPHCGGDLRDARERVYRVRLRLYDTRSASADDPIADSAEGLPADQPGIDRISGLPAIMAEAMTMAHQFHDRPLRGWDHETVGRKIRGVRPTLSRTGGRGTIRVEYDTPESFTDGRTPPRFVARIDLVRDDSAMEKTL